MYVSSQDTTEVEPEQTVVACSCVRLDAADYALVVKQSEDGQSIVTPDCEGTSRSTMILHLLASTSADSDLQNSSGDESIGETQ